MMASVAIDEIDSIWLISDIYSIPTDYALKICGV